MPNKGGRNRFRVLRQDACPAAKRRFLSGIHAVKGTQTGCRLFRGLARKHAAGPNHLLQQTGHAIYVVPASAPLPREPAAEFWRSYGHFSSAEAARTRRNPVSQP